MTCLKMASFFPSFCSIMNDKPIICCHIIKLLTIYGLLDFVLHILNLSPCESGALRGAETHFLLTSRLNGQENVVQTSVIILMTLNASAKLHCYYQLTSVSRLYSLLSESFNNYTKSVFILQFKSFHTYFKGLFVNLSGLPSRNDALAPV